MSAQNAQKRDKLRKEVLDDFTGWFKLFAKGVGIDALGSALTAISLSGKDDDPGNAVRLMTLHSAKGLEFDHVHIVGLDDGTFPHQSAIEEGRLEEERRLLYVGITRARKTLCLSYPLTRSRYGNCEHTDPSRFIKELPSEVMEGTAQPSEARNQKLAMGHLAAMRALLND